MNLGVWVRSFAHRNLRSATLYSNVEHLDTKPEIPLRSEETLIGVYSNSSDSIFEVIGITDCGLHINSKNGWRWVPYGDICTSHLPEKLKEPPFLPEHLDIELCNGEFVRLPIRGRSGDEGQFSDVYRFEGFLSGISRVMT